MKRYKWVLLGIALSLLIIYNVVFGDYGLRYIYKLDADYRNLVVNVLNLKQKNKTIEQKINLFQEDDSFAEKVGREQCGLAKPGEVVYKIKKLEGND